MSEYYVCGCPSTTAGVIHRHDCIFIRKMMDEATRDTMRFISRVTNPDGGCPACAAKDAEIARLTAGMQIERHHKIQAEARLARVVEVGHNDDCLFCGLKDQIAIADAERTR